MKNVIYENKKDFKYNRINNTYKQLIIMAIN